MGASTDSVLIRPACPEECTALTSLAFASKAIWGYDAHFMSACREELTVGPEDIELAAFVAEKDGEKIGFYTLDEVSATDAELGYLFVHPDWIGRGIGRALATHAVQTASAMGYARLTIVGDPHAEPFYLAMGARRVGEVPSAGIPGRFLPLFHVALDTNTDQG